MPTSSSTPHIPSIGSVVSKSGNAMAVGSDSSCYGTVSCTLHGRCRASSSAYVAGSCYVGSYG